MNRRGKPYSELASTNLFAFYSVSDIKAWREQEFNAGRLSGQQDFYLAHGLCWSCKATGVAISPVDWDGDIPLFEQCNFCGGTARVRTS
jgi:hypothetical protein